MNQNNNCKIYSTTLLNQSGDLTFSWTDKDKDKVLKVIQDKIDQGCIFFELKRPEGFLGFLRKKREYYINSSKEISGNQVVFKDVHDSDFESLLKSGVGAVTSTPTQTNGAMSTVRRLNSAEEVIKSNSAMVQPIFGG